MLPVTIPLNRLLVLTGCLWLTLGCPERTLSSSAWFARVWQTDDGLLNNNIHSIVQTADRYLWVATPVSLMRFDGVAFSPFPVKDFTGQIEPHNVRMVFLSRSGVLWIVPNLGTMVGLNPDFSRVALPRSILPTNTPPTLAEDGEGSLWLGYPGAIYQVKGQSVTQFGTGEGMPQNGGPTLVSDGTGHIWLAKGRQICRFQAGQFRPAARLDGIQCLTASHTNAIWLVASRHLYRCATDGALQDCGEIESSPSANIVALLEDHTGAVWVGTDGNGLFRYHDSAFERIETSHSSVLALTEDQEGNIWVGTGGGGLDRLFLSSVQQETFVSNQILEQIQSVAEDAQGKLWGATHNGLLVSWSDNRWNPELPNAPFTGSVMCVTAGNAGGIWIGTRNGRLFDVNGTNYTSWELTNGPIAALENTPSGELWVVGRRLQRFHDGSVQTVDLPRQVQKISAIARDAHGNLWIGARGIVMRYDGSRFVDETPNLPVSRRSVCCLYPTPDGSMWISCGGAGLLRFKNGQVGQIGAEQGLFNTYISQIIADHAGWIWFGSDRGIFKVRQAELEQATIDHNRRLRPIVYGRNEGLPSLEAVFSTAAPYVLPRSVLTHDGRVWLLMHTGVVVANPNVLAENFPAPPVLLTELAMDGQTIASYGNTVPTWTVASLQPLNRPLRLPPGHRHLKFNFTAIHLSAPENVRFRYQLLGFDNDWIDAETMHDADYSRLPEGNYQFRVQACIGDGRWTETAAVLPLSVTPFLWQTWWFQLAAVGLFTALVIAMVRYISFRRLQLQMRLLEQRAALDKERTRIARDLHDDLGGSLNSAALALDMMQRGAAAAEGVLGRLRHCSTMVRQAAKSVDEIVWAINPRNDTLRYVVDYISQYAVEFMHAADLPCRVELPDKIPDRLLSPEARHNLFLVVKEALSNIVRHAQASEVRLLITTMDGQIVIAIEDNGLGFEGTPDNARSDGLRNMRQRMEEIGGEFQLTTRPGAGTRVTFAYTWQSNRGNNGNPNMPYQFSGDGSKQ